MSNLTLTKDNYLEFLRPWNVAPKTFVESLKKLCKIAPEFTHEPQMKIFKDGLLYESNYSYGKFKTRLKFTFFCLVDKKINKHKTLTFGLKSFGIKTASSSQVKKMCGESPPWFDLEGKLNQETRELVQEYINYRYQLECES